MEPGILTSVKLPKTLNRIDSALLALSDVTQRIDHVFLHLGFALNLVSKVCNVPVLGSLFFLARVCFLQYRRSENPGGRQSTARSHHSDFTPSVNPIDPSCVSPCFLAKTNLQGHCRGTFQKDVEVPRHAACASPLPMQPVPVVPSRILKGRRNIQRVFPA